MLALESIFPVCKIYWKKTLYFLKQNTNTHSWQHHNMYEIMKLHDMQEEKSREYRNIWIQTYAPSRSLRSASERRLVVPSQRGTKSLSRTFSWTVPSWWNDLPISIRTAESLAIFKKHLKTCLFRQHLTN